MHKRIHYFAGMGLVWQISRRLNFFTFFVDIRFSRSKRSLSCCGAKEGIPSSLLLAFERDLTRI